MSLKTRGKYSVLFLHDDGTSKSFRLKRSTLRFCVFLICILPIIGIGGGFFGMMALERERLWMDEEKNLQNEMASLKMQLNRLGHIEKLLQEHENDSTPRNAAALRAAGAKQSGQTAAPAARAGQAAGENTPTQAVAQNTQAASATVSSSATSANSVPDRLTAIDIKQVRLDRVSARLANDRSLRVRLDLYNEIGRQISGRMLFFALTPDGRKVAIEHDDPTFRINFMKRVNSTATIPDNLPNIARSSLIIEIVNNAQILLYRQTYPIN